MAETATKTDLSRLSDGTLRSFAERQGWRRWRVVKSRRSLRLFAVLCDDCELLIDVLTFKSLFIVVLRCKSSRTLKGGAPE